MRLWRWSIVLLLLGAAAGFGARLDDAALRDSLSRVHPRMRASWLRERGLDDSYYTTFHRPESTGLSCVGRWPWGPSWELAGRDTFLYLGSGSGVRILSIADSVQPRMLGQVNARGLVSQIVVQDTLLFVACGSWGAQIYSVSDPANPREIGSMDAVIGTICAQDTVCFTLGGDSLTIYDVANPGQPMRLAAVQDAGGILAFDNGYVFSAGSDGLNVYDVHVPTSPTRVGTRGGSYLGLFARGTLLFCTGIQPSYFTILDVSNPASMVQLGTIDGYGGEDICVLGNLACLSCVYDHDGLYTIDVSDSTHPSILGNYVPDGAEFFDVYIRPDGLRSYIASWYGGLSVGDVSNPNTPHEVWFGYQADEAVDVAVDGSRAYAADMSGGMRILDVSDPHAPTELGLYDVIGNKDVRTATAWDSFAFVSRAGSAGRKYLHVLDVLDPSNPTLVAQESCYNPPEDYVLRDSLLYAAEENQFQVFNVARPREPVRVGSCDGDGVSIVLRDTFAYTAAGAIRVTNIARPDSPFVVTTIGRSSWDLSIVDSMLFCQPGPAIWYSLANPAVPVPVDSIDMGHWIVGMTAVNRTIYACSGPSYTTLYAISIADLHRPRVIDQTTLPYTVKRITYAAPYLYLSCWEAGVAIYETTSVGIGERPAVSTQPACLRVWPNVTFGKVQFTAGVTARANDVAVFDISGKRLRNVTLQLKAKGGAVTEGMIDLTGLAAGVYVFRVESEGTHFTAKVVKTNRR